MRKLFDPDSLLMRNLSKLADLMFCNIIFCILCLPVVTAGAALAALYSCAFALMEDREDTFIVRQFFKSFIRCFKSSTLVWLITLGCMIFLGLYYFAISYFTGTLSKVYRITFFILCILFLMGFQYFFPLAAYYDLKPSQILKKSWYLSVTALPWTLLSIVVSAILIYITFFMDTAMFQRAIFLWVTILFGVMSYINCHFFLNAFKKLPDIHYDPPYA